MSKLSTPLGVASIIFIILGVLTLMAGVVTLIVNQKDPSLSYIWALIILGIVMLIAGGIMLAIAISRNDNRTVSYANIVPSLPINNSVPLLPINNQPYYATDLPNIHITNVKTEGNSVVSSSLNTTSFNSPQYMSTT